MNMRSNIIFIFTIALGSMPASGAPPRSNGPIAYTVRAMKKHPFAAASIIALGTSCWIYRTQTKKDKKNATKNEKLVAISTTIQEGKTLLQEEKDYCLLLKSKQVETALTNYRTYLNTKKEFRDSAGELMHSIARCMSAVSQAKGTNQEKVAAGGSLSNFNKALGVAKDRINSGTLQTLTYPPHLELLDTFKLDDENPPTLLKKYFSDLIERFNTKAAAFVNRNKNAPAELIAALNKAHQPESFFMKEVIGAIAVGSAIGIAGAYGLHTLLSYTDY